MRPQLTRMTLDEFIKKLLAGERDLSYIALPPFSNLSGHEGYEELRQYLQQQDLEKNPVAITNSNLRGLIALSLYLPYLEAGKVNLREANIKHANLMGSIFRAASLREAKFIESNFRKANLMYASLVYSNFRDSDLREANLLEANLYRANFEKTRLKDVMNLEYALNLGYAIFLNTRITKTQQEFIEKAIARRPWLIVE